MVFIIHIVLSVQLQLFFIKRSNKYKINSCTRAYNRFRKIALTNSLSRKISNKELTIDEAKSEFIHLQHASLQYSFNEFLCSCHCMWLLPIYVWRCRIRLLDCSHCWWIRILTFSFVQRYIQIKFSQSLLQPLWSYQLQLHLLN